MASKIKWKDLEERLNKILVVAFWDHAMGDEPVRCHAVGYLAKIAKRHIMLVSWDCVDLDGDDRLANMEYFSILKSAIYEVKPLVMMEDQVIDKII